jgi:hypothetical protein
LYSRKIFGLGGGPTKERCAQDAWPLFDFWL